MNFPAGTTIEQKRARCRPEVYRYRYPEARMATSHAYPNALQSCHEIEIYPDDRLACASITATILFDLKGAFDDRGTPNDFTDDKPRGTPLPCRVRESTARPARGLKTGAPIIDCVDRRRRDGKDQPLRVSRVAEDRLAVARGRRVDRHGAAHGLHRHATTIVNAPYDSKSDILAAHESELSQSGRFVITTDERGGGVVPRRRVVHARAPTTSAATAACTSSRSATSRTNTPLTTDAGAGAVGQDVRRASKAIYRANIRTGPQGSFCTAHVFQQIPGQNRIFMGWYSQGTQVVRLHRERRRHGRLPRGRLVHAREREHLGLARLQGRSATATARSPTGARRATASCPAPAAARSTSTR